MLKPSTMVFLNKGDNQCKNARLDFLLRVPVLQRRDYFVWSQRESDNVVFCQQKYLTFTETSGNNSNTAQRKKQATPA